ncbi:MAG: F510_1955 family glycosylhydrolase [Casimicrobiaceae bacterium]
MLDITRPLRGLCLALTLIAVATGARAENVTLTHVHGLGFSNDGAELVVPSHHGLAVYRDGAWSKAPGPAHDYMGFVATGKRYYSSGHPAPGTNLVNPFGLIRSDDNGKTWTKLGLEGQSDFHLMAASAETNAVYVFNTGPNARMPQAGLYWTANDGLAWRPAQAQGLQGRLQAIAVHPVDAKTVAVGTSEGLFLSTDAGDHFRPIARGMQTLALMFARDGATLWASAADRTAHLYRVEWKSGGKTEAVMPPLDQDAVAYIAQNPVRPAELAIATFQKSVFVSADDGKSWKRIADRGRAL